MTRDAIETWRHIARAPSTGRTGLGRVPQLSRSAIAQCDDRKYWSRVRKMTLEPPSHVGLGSGCPCTPVTTYGSDLVRSGANAAFAPVVGVSLYYVPMGKCTAPVRGHRSSAAAADCPDCGGRSYGSSYSSYYSPSTSYNIGGGSRSGSSSGGGSSRRTRTGRSVSYSPAEWRTVEPYVEKAVEQARVYPDRRDLFLCHAWGDRQGSAAEFHGHLKSNGASVWFSEEDLPLGSLMIREIDKGLRNSRIGIVLVTPALIKSINAEGIAEKELAVLLASRRVIPVMHGVTFDELNNVSPMLASHAGLNTADSSLDDVAAKVAAAAAAQAA